MRTPATSGDMAKRMTITIDDDVYEVLEEWADEEVRTVANLASAIVTLKARERRDEKEETPKAS